jgi:hypothetical protein
MFIGYRQTGVIYYSKSAVSRTVKRVKISVPSQPLMNHTT